MPNKTKDSELQGLGRLITEATVGIIELVEAMHNRIIYPPFLPSTPVQHLVSKIAGTTYKNIKLGTQFIGSGADKALGKLAPLLGKIKTAEKREMLLSVLNGVIGDYLKNKDNPLAIPMQFRHRSKTLLLKRKSLEKNFPVINGKILLMVHGSCMNDIQWSQKDHNHGMALAKDLEMSPIYLYYNSGLHISTNGQIFSELLEELVLNWPSPIEELIIVAHSMGGLVSRSAIYYGEQLQKTWPKHLKKIVFLGTPHHGARLERMGNYLNIILEHIPYTKPFARLGKIRSAGVTDLRYGNLVDQDWQGIDRFQLQGDQRQNVPLPENIECFSIAGNYGKKEDASSKYLGDRLVSVKSALGIHKNPAKHLNFKKKNTWIAYENSHMDLLSNSKVYAQIKEWLI